MTDESLEGFTAKSEGLTFGDKLRIAFTIGGVGLVLAGLFWLSKVEEHFPQYEPGQNPTSISQERTPDDVNLREQ